MHNYDPDPSQVKMDYFIESASYIFIHESQNFRNEWVSVANEWVSKVLQLSMV